jgi:hypothetical protein
MDETRSRSLFAKLAICLFAVLLASTCVYGARRRSSRSSD